MKLENNMDVLKMLADLRHEREQIEEAIVTLERLARGRGTRRGRPPAWMSAIKRRGRPPGSKNKSQRERRSANNAHGLRWCAARRSAAIPCTLESGVSAKKLTAHVKAAG